MCQADDEDDKRSGLHPNLVVSPDLWSGRVESVGGEVSRNEDRDGAN